METHAGHSDRFGSFGMGESASVRGTEVQAQQAMSLMLCVRHTFCCQKFVTTHRTTPFSGVM